MSENEPAAELRETVRKRICEEIRRELQNAYHNRDDYPPFALMSWDDRQRYGEYVYKIIDEVALRED